MWTDDRIAGELETNNGVHPRLDGLVSVIDGENQRLLGSLRPETRVESRHSLVEWRSLTVLVSVGPALVGTIGHAVWRWQSASHSMLLVVRQLEVGGSSS